MSPVACDFGGVLMAMTSLDGSGGARNRPLCTVQVLQLFLSNNATNDVVVM